MSEQTLQSRNVPRWKSIRDELRSEIGNFSYGESFYSIAQVCQRFEVSTITAIRSLTELVNEQLIEKVHGKGHIVRAVGGTCSMRLILPAKAHVHYITLDSVVRRLYDGILRATEIPGLTFSTISEAHLQTLFPRSEDKSGFIIHRGVSHETLDFLRQHNLPYVLLDPLDHYVNQPHARVDRVKAGYLATRHLIELGHRRIAWVNGPCSQKNFRQRLIGYRNALREEGIKFSWQLIYESLESKGEQEVWALSELLKLRHPPTAIIAAEDTRAMYLLAACRKRGLSVPGDMNIVGYPNNPESSMTEPALTVVDAMYEKVSHAAVRLLFALMQNKTAEKNSIATAQDIISPELIIRQSTCKNQKRSGKLRRAVGTEKLSNTA